MIRLRSFILMIPVLIILGAGQVLAAGSGAFRNESPAADAFGKGSAFVGEANTPSAIYYNPAGLNQVKGFQISAGGAYIAPKVKHTAPGGQETEMKRNNFFVPHVYAVVPVNQKLTLGFGSSSYWGLGTEWAADSFSKYIATKTELEVIDTMMTGSWQVNDQWSVAASVDNSNAKVSKNKLLFNAGNSADGNTQIKAKDNSWGYRLATLFKINDQNQVGFMYRSKVKQTYKGKIYIEGIDTVVYGGSNFNSTNYETRITSKSTLPQSVVLGYSFKPNHRWTWNIDLEWMNWSKIKNEKLNYPDETDAGRLGILNVGNPAARDWRNAFSQAIGFEYAATDTLRLRGGYYHHQHVIPEGTFESTIPDSDSHGLTAGFGYDLSKNITLDLGYSLLMYETRDIDNAVTVPSTGASIDGKYRQYLNEGIATVTYKF